jgi:hypothetical protein
MNIWIKKKKATHYPYNLSCSNPFLVNQLNQERRRKTLWWLMFCVYWLDHALTRCLGRDYCESVCQMSEHLNNILSMVDCVCFLQGPVGLIQCTEGWNRTGGRIRQNALSLFPSFSYLSSNWIFVFCLFIWNGIYLMGSPLLWVSSLSLAGQGLAASISMWANCFVYTNWFCFLRG